MDQNEIVNRVANSSLVTFNLEELLPSSEQAEVDLKDLLFKNLILREKDLREFIKIHEWRQYVHKNVAVFCSADAIIPTWAYMLISIALQPYAKLIVFGNREVLTMHESFLPNSV